MKKDKCFRTTNLNLAVFLFASDQQIGGINPVNADQKEFAFIKTNSLEELAWLYRYGDKDDDRLSVPVHKYEQARRELLDRLND
jgi:hypothetical protein